MKYSVIIPTMYLHLEQLNGMLAVYDSLPCIGEIIIVNNNGSKKVDLPFNKVRTIGDGNNLFVNPSWKFGVTNAKFDRVILANDDITIVGDLEKLLGIVDSVLTNDMVIGPCESNFGQGDFSQQITLSKIENKRKLSYGYGTFMILDKFTFLSTAIPSDFLVWYGDAFLFFSNTALSFKGLNIITRMAGTSSTLNLRKQKELELFAWGKYN